MIAVVSVLFPLVTGCGGPTVAPTPGHEAPPFTLSTLSGETVDLSSLLRNHKPIVLNAWASWCGPCTEETPDLVKLAKAYQGRVQVVGINMTSTDNVGDAKAFVRQYHIPYTVLLDPYGKFLTNYLVQGFPTTFLISPTGRVIRVDKGAMSSQAMQALFQQASALQYQA